MRDAEKAAFAQLVKDAMAFYRRDVSTFALDVWWQACRPFSLDQVAKALTAHATNPERGQFAPMPADIVRELDGTRSDRSLVAWGKVYDAMARVGSYSSVAFDEVQIHAAIEDMGGWPKLCQTATAELPFVQKRFCETYRAYAARPESPPHSPVLPGVHATNNARFNRSEPCILIGDRGRANAIAKSGGIERGTMLSPGVATEREAARLASEHARLAAFPERAAKADATET